MKRISEFVLHSMKECGKHVLYSRYGIPDKGSEKDLEKKADLEAIDSCHEIISLKALFECLEIAESEFLERLYHMLSS